MVRSVNLHDWNIHFLLLVILVVPIIIVGFFVVVLPVVIVPCETLAASAPTLRTGGLEWRSGTLSSRAPQIVTANISGISCCINVSKALYLQIKGPLRKTKLTFCAPTLKLFAGRIITERWGSGSLSTSDITRKFFFLVFDPIRALKMSKQSTENSLSDLSSYLAIASFILAVSPALDAPPLVPARLSAGVDRLASPALDIPALVPARFKAGVAESVSFRGSIMEIVLS